MRDARRRRPTLEPTPAEEARKVSIEELMLRGLLLGLPLAILPGAFVDAAIHEARRNGFVAVVTLPLQRALLEGPLFLLLAALVAQLPLGFLDH